MQSPMETTPKHLSDFRGQPLHVAQLKNALLTVKTVMAQTGLGRSTIHNKVKDGTFPAPIKLSARCVRWQARCWGWAPPPCWLRRSPSATARS